jgi:tetratricopeptide (TPR) repeat protein
MLRIPFRPSCALSIAALTIAWATPAIAQGPASSSPPAAARPPAASPEPLAARLARVQADLYGRAEHVEADVEELKAILGIDPTIAEAHMLLGLAYRALGRPELVGESKAELQEALALKPELIPARYFLAEVYLGLGRYENVQREMQTALQQVPGQPQFLAVLGEAERHLGNAARSAELNQQALARDPTFSRARYYLALAQLDLGQRDQAIANLEQVAATNVREPDVYLTLGRTYIDAGRTTNATTVLEEAATMAPGRADVHIALARAYRLRGLLTKAAAQLTAAKPAGSAVQPTEGYQQVEADLNMEWGWVRLRQGQLANAGTAFQKAIDIAPDKGEAHQGLAVVYLRQREYARAQAEADRAAALGSPLSAADRKTLDAGLQRPAAGSAQ